MSAQIEVAVKTGLTVGKWGLRPHLKIIPLSLNASSKSTFLSTNFQFYTHKKSFFVVSSCHFINNIINIFHEALHSRTKADSLFPGLNGLT